MGEMQRWLMLGVSALPLVACSVQSEPEPDVAVAVAALSACGETAPADRAIDGIPAYAQCDATQNSAIYSNNGVDTSTTQMSPDWVRTQYSGGYQCTELAHRYLYFVWDVDWIPRGNAGQWCDEQPPESSGLVQTMEPVHGDLMVLAPGSCGAAAGTGHVNVVDVVDGSGRLVAVEQNRARRGTYEQSCARCFLHVVANTGDGTQPPPAAGTGAAGTGAAGTGAGGTTEPPPQVPPAAGTAATPPTTPPPAVPTTPEPAPTTPPAGPTGEMPAATPLAPPLPPPAAYLGAAGAGVQIPARLQQDSSSEGCSVGRIGGSDRAARSHAVSLAVMLAFAGIAVRRRARAR